MRSGALVVASVTVAVASVVAGGVTVPTAGACPVPAYAIEAPAELPPVPTVYVVARRLVFGYDDVDGLRAGPVDVVAPFALWAPIGPFALWAPIELSGLGVPDVVVRDRGGQRVPTELRPVVVGATILFALTIRRAAGEVSIEVVDGDGPTEHRIGSGARPSRRAAVTRIDLIEDPMFERFGGRLVGRAEPRYELTLDGPQVAYWSIETPGCPVQAVVTERDPIKVVALPARCLAGGSRVDVVAHRYDGSDQRLVITVPAGRRPAPRGVRVIIGGLGLMLALGLGLGLTRSWRRRPAIG